jgi:hypothetical protein
VVAGWQPSCKVPLDRHPLPVGTVSSSGRGVRRAPAIGAVVSSDLIPPAKLIALLRRYMMEHAKSATRSICHCAICVDARKLLDKSYGERTPG